MKYVYLDQMKWIDLSRAAWGVPGGKQFEKTLEASRKAVQELRVIFPLSSAHIIETNKCGKSEQRRRLASVMIELSQGVVLRNAELLVESEIRRALGILVDGSPTNSLPHPFGRGIEEAFGEDFARDTGMPPEKAALLRTIIDTPNGWMMFLDPEDEFRLPGVNSVRRLGTEAAAKLNQALLDSGPPQYDGYKRAYAAGLTMLFEPVLSRLLGERGLTPKDFLSFGKEKLLTFWESIPCLDVEMELSVQRNLQRSRAVQPNDYTDISFLGTGIPYCDVVVTERFWVDLAKRNGLGKKYETEIIHNLEDLGPLIER